MSFRQPSSVSSTSDLANTTKTSKQSKNSTKFGICQVCGDKASIINYGALTCESCKVFFRRNGYHPENVRACLFDGACEIDMNTRRSCTSCRLAKCLSVGMNSNLIRKEVRLNTKRSSTKTSNIDQSTNRKQVKCLPQFIILDPPRNDLLALKDSEWILFSNVIHAYDTFCSTAQIHRSIEELSISLPSNISCNVSSFYEIINLMYKSMQSLISSVPDFRVLTLNEQYSLYERNLHGVMALYTTLFIRTTNIVKNPKCMETFVNLYGIDMMHRLKHIDKQLDFDLDIIKLMLIVLAFSSNCFLIYKNEKISNDSLLNGTFRLYGSQTVYVELLWKYMIYRYGYYDTVHRFCRLIQICFDLIKYHAMIYINNQTYHSLVKHILEQTKTSLLIDQNEERSLWGKP